MILFDRVFLFLQFNNEGAQLFATNSGGDNQIVCVSYV